MSQILNVFLRQSYMIDTLLTFAAPLGFFILRRRTVTSGIIATERTLPCRLNQTSS